MTLADYAIIKSIMIYLCSFSIEINDLIKQIDLIVST